MLVVDVGPKGREKGRDKQDWKSELDTGREFLAGRQQEEFYTRNCLVTQVKTQLQCPRKNS